jgi:PTS system enzyme IIBC component
MKNYFKEENIFLNFNANDRKDFLSKISKILLEKKYVKEGFNDSIIKREEKYPTGLDFGEYKIAIPHTDPEYVNEEGIVTVKLKNPIIFRDMGLDENDLEVSVIFVLLVQKGEEQVNLLTKLMSLLEQKEVYNAIRNASDKEEILRILSKNF